MPETKSAPNTKGRELSWIERVTRSEVARLLPRRLRGIGGRILLAWLRLKHPRGLKCCPYENQEFRVLPECRFASWNPGEVNAFMKAIKSDATVLDIGANIGVYTLVFAEAVGPGGKVIAFEPDTRVSGFLRRHLAMNGYEDRVKLEELAVTDSTGRAFFGLGPALGMAGVGSSGDQAQVSSTTLQDYCSSNALQPDMIKMDIEGAEVEVLRASGSFLAGLTPECRLFVELHPTVWRHQGLDPQTIIETWNSGGWEVRPLEPDTDPLLLEGCCVELVQKAV